VRPIILILEGKMGFHGETGIVVAAARKRKFLSSAGFERNHHELLALIAPRAFLVLAGESGSGAADGDRSRPFIEAALPVYRLFGGSPRIGLLNHRHGHTIPPDVYDRLAEWLEIYLK